MALLHLEAPTPLRTEVAPSPNGKGEPERSNETAPSINLPPSWNGPRKGMQRQESDAREHGAQMDQARGCTLPGCAAGH